MTIIRSPIRSPIYSPLYSPLTGKYGAVWTPAKLFANGELGGWWEASPEYLFQDASATTPVTADGQAVGAMLDRSGNNLTILQATEADQPVYKTDGTYHWIETDGVGDNMDVNAPATEIEGTLIVGSVRLLELKSGGRPFFGIYKDADERGGLLVGSSNSSIHSYTTALGSDTAADLGIVDEDVVFSCVATDAEAFGRLAGVDLYRNAPPNNPPNSGGSGVYAIMQTGIKGRFYGGAIVHASSFSAADIQSAEQYFAGLMP